MTKGFIGMRPTNGHGEIGNERTTTSQPTNVIRELVQTTGVAELTVESTKTESSAINLYQKPERD
jgi:hypothetical protein